MCEKALVDILSWNSKNQFSPFLFKTHQHHCGTVFLNVLPCTWEEKIKKKKERGKGREGKWKKKYVNTRQINSQYCVSLLACGIVLMPLL